jgi:hypothetical protein
MMSVRLFHEVRRLGGAEILLDHCQMDLDDWKAVVRETPIEEFRANFPVSSAGLNSSQLLAFVGSCSNLHLSSVAAFDLFEGPFRDIVWGFRGRKLLEYYDYILSPDVPKEPWLREKFIEMYFDFGDDPTTMTHLYLPLPEYLPAVDSATWDSLEVLSLDPGWLGFEKGVGFGHTTLSSSGNLTFGDRQFPKLRELYLGGQHRIENVDFLLAMPSIEILQIDFADLSGDAIVQLDEILPDLPQLHTLIAFGGDVTLLSHIALKNSKSLKQIICIVTSDDDRGSLLKSQVPTNVSVSDVEQSPVPHSFLDHRERVIQQIRSRFMGEVNDRD